MDDKLKDLREAWLDVPFDCKVEVGTGPWLQKLINAVSAIVDPDRTLRETPEAQQRGRLAGYRSQFAWWSEQLKLSDAHGMTEQAAKAKVERDTVASLCMTEFGVVLE